MDIQEQEVSRKKDYNPFKVIETNRYIYSVILALTYTATILSLLDPILNAFKRGDIVVSTVYSLFFLFVLTLGILLRPKRAAIHPPQRGKFRGIGGIDKQNAWQRMKDSSKLSMTIKKSTKHPIILVGASGVGKTVLLETQVIPALKEEKWEYIVFSNYDNFEAELVNEVFKKFPRRMGNDSARNQILAAIDKRSKILFVFDQFEQFLSENSSNDDKSENTRKTFKAFLEDATDYENVRIVIVVRKEWYYDLRFLDQFIPSPYESLHLSGIKMDEDLNKKLLLNTMHTALKNPKLADAVLQSLINNDEILPVEAQAVGLMMENKVRDSGTLSIEDYFEKLGGKDGVIRSYFQTYLDASPDRNISLQVLFALSIETQLRIQLSCDEIADIVHKSRDDVQDCLNFFKEQELVRVSHTGLYILVHDFLAAKLHELSGTELEPLERDNILFFWDKNRKQSHFTVTRPRRRFDKKLIFSDYFMIFLAVLLVARLTGPLYHLDWGWFNKLNVFQAQSLGIDFNYIPIFISHLAWSIYVTSFYRRFFSLLRESLFSRILSKYTVINCTACVVTAVFLPYYWILSIGIGGLFIGLKMYQLSRSKGLSKISNTFFRNMATPTCINLAFIIILGLALIFYVERQAPSAELAEQIVVLSFFAAIVLTYFMVIVSPSHITRNAASKMLGMIDRTTLSLRDTKNSQLTMNDIKKEKISR